MPHASRVRRSKAYTRLQQIKLVMQLTNNHKQEILRWIISKWMRAIRKRDFLDSHGDGKMAIPFLMAGRLHGLRHRADAAGPTLPPFRPSHRGVAGLHFRWAGNQALLALAHFVGNKYTLTPSNIAPICFVPLNRNVRYLDPHLLKHVQNDSLGGFRCGIHISHRLSLYDMMWHTVRKIVKIMHGTYGSVTTTFHLSSPFSSLSLHLFSLSHSLWWNHSGKEAGEDDSDDADELKQGTAVDHLGRPRAGQHHGPRRSRLPFPSSDAG